MKDAKDYPMVSSSLRKVQKSCSLQWYSVQQIKAIAFVFHIEDVNEGRYSCSGMKKNAFIIRSAAPVYLRLPLPRLTSLIPLGPHLVTARVVLKGFGIALHPSRSCVRGA
jgi:hypothetical protein